MRVAELVLAAIVGAFAALAIVNVATAVLDRLEPVSTVLVDPPATAPIFKTDWTQCATAPARPLLQPPVPRINRERGKPREGGNA